jgi:predicted transcriptional regulator
MASAEILSNKDLATFKELLMANSIQVDALAQLLIEKGLISREEFFKNLKEVESGRRSFCI